VVDTFDAITTSRPYRVARSLKDGFKELESWAGKHFAPEIVRSCRHITEKDLPIGRSQVMTLDGLKALAGRLMISAEMPTLHMLVAYVLMPRQGWASLRRSVVMPPKQ
jgi:hypothetical protein